MNDLLKAKLKKNENGINQPAFVIMEYIRLMEKYAL
ncbi:hypothetical protein JOC76_003857 [Neobacillus cucumis]|nr:hypothetical protein [Neobacillus cucumis]